MLLSIENTQFSSLQSKENRNFGSYWKSVSLHLNVYAERAGSEDKILLKVAVCCLCLVCPKWTEQCNQHLEQCCKWHCVQHSISLPFTPLVLSALPLLQYSLLVWKVLEISPGISPQIRQADQEDFCCMQFAARKTKKCCPWSILRNSWSGITSAHFSSPSGVVAECHF